MAKIGRPRKQRPQEESSPTTVEQRTDTYSVVYSPSFEARRVWFVGVKVDQEKHQLPFYNRGFGGIPFQYGTQKPQMSEDLWLTLDGHRTRVVRQHLDALKIKRAVLSIRNTVVRWKAARHATSGGEAMTRWSAEILSLETRVKSFSLKEKAFLPVGYLNNAQSTDVPVSKYLVLIPRDLVTDRGAGIQELDIDSLPSMFDLDPTLVPDRMRVVEAGSVTDEPW